MKSEVVILGLFRRGSGDWSALKSAGCKVWSVNDWYQFYPTLTDPDLVFNIHYAPHVNETDPTRFSGDWKLRYNNAIAHGGRIVVVDPIEGVDRDGQVLLPVFDYVQKNGPASIPCSISAMIHYAIMDPEIKKIHLRGVVLRDPEYVSQVWGILEAIRLAELSGIEVDNPHAEEWESRRSRLDFIDWGKRAEEFVNTGSVRHLHRYFAKHLVKAVEEVKEAQKKKPRRPRKRKP